MNMDPKEMKQELARILSTMPYMALLGVAKELFEMNSGENVGLRDMTNKYGMAETLIDWAEATVSDDQ
jgi:hypothetical protein